MHMMHRLLISIMKGILKGICTSINDVVCHGIPDAQVVLKMREILLMLMQRLVIRGIMRMPLVCL